MALLPLNMYCDTRWSALLDAVKEDVNSHPDANLDSGELCKTTWECYAYCSWTNGPYAGLYESDLVDPACERACADLPEFELTALLSWQWDEYLEENDPGVKYPWQMSVTARRQTLVDILQSSARLAASSDGAAIQDR